MTRTPFRETRAGESYRALGRLPVVFLLDGIRSLYNVGSFFRTADAAGIQKLYLCNITAHPPHKQISKTALGAENTVAWEHRWRILPLLETLNAEGYEIAAVETTDRAMDLFDWTPRFPVCVIFGHEVEGIRPEVLERCRTHVYIPMLGSKHSLNVATAGGVVAYELLRKFRSAGAKGI